MIDVGISQKNACDLTVAQLADARLQLRHAFNLPRQIGRCVDQEPALKLFRVAADGDTGLRLGGNFARARSDAVHTGTIPLRQATAGCAPENVDANQPELSE